MLPTLSSVSWTGWLCPGRVNGNWEQRLWPVPTHSGLGFLCRLVHTPKGRRLTLGAGPLLPPQAPLDQLPLNAVFGSHAASVVPSLIFPGRDSSAYCRTMMAILNAKEKHTHRTVFKYSRLTHRPTNHLAGTLASRHSYKRNFQASSFFWKLSCAPD